MQVRVYGASDDLVEIVGSKHPICEEYGPTPINGVETFRAVIADTASSDAAILHVQYADPGCWMVGLSPYDEEYPIPASWNPTIGFDPDLCRYSAVLTLDLPDTATLEVLDGRDPRKEQ